MFLILGSILLLIFDGNELLINVCWYLWCIFHEKYKTWRRLARLLRWIVSPRYQGSTKSARFFSSGFYHLKVNYQASVDCWQPSKSHLVISACIWSDLCRLELFLNTDFKWEIHQFWVVEDGGNMTRKKNCPTHPRSRDLEHPCALIFTVLLHYFCLHSSWMNVKVIRGKIKVKWNWTCP